MRQPTTFLEVGHDPTAKPCTWTITLTLQSRQHFYPVQTLLNLVSRDDLWRPNLFGSGVSFTQASSARIFSIFEYVRGICYRWYVTLYSLPRCAHAYTLAKHDFRGRP